MRFLFCVFLLTFPIFTPYCEAQQLKEVPLSFSNRNIISAGNTPPSLIPHPLLLPTYSLSLTPYPSLPKGAIFCRMEDAIYKKLNFWVKFRMGTDDRYSN